LPQDYFQYEDQPLLMAQSSMISVESEGVR